MSAEGTARFSSHPHLVSALRGPSVNGARDTALIQIFTGCGRCRSVGLVEARGAGRQRCAVRTPLVAMVTSAATTPIGRSLAVQPPSRHVEPPSCYPIGGRVREPEFAVVLVTGDDDRLGRTDHVPAGTG